MYVRRERERGRDVMQLLQLNVIRDWSNGKCGGCLIARVDSSLPADARPTRKLESSSRLRLVEQLLNFVTTTWTNLVRRNYNPCPNLNAMYVCFLTMPVFLLSLLTSCVIRETWRTNEKVSLWLSEMISIRKDN